MENYRIDSHKLMFHPQRVAEWQEGRVVYPINAEVGLSGACNHRCIFCAVDYTGYKPQFLTKEILHERFGEMYSKGLKSVLFAGTGEPLLNTNASDIINDTKDLGIDVALSTNGVLFDKNIARECMKSISWIRFSISAGTEDTYKKIHRGNEGDLERVFQNIYDAAQLKKKNNWNTVLGVQIVMIPENQEEVLVLAQKVKELGADQFSVKIFCCHPLSHNELNQFDRLSYYDCAEEIGQQLNQLSDENFRAVFRSNLASKIKMERGYNECYAMPFHMNIDAGGDVWPCCTLVGMEDMCFGNIYQNTFEEIWLGCKRESVVQRIKEMNLSMCNPECKLDEMNRYLHELKYPNAHINFI